MKPPTAVFIGLAAATAAFPAAASPPGSPVELTVHQRTDQLAVLHWRNTHSAQQSVAYFVDQTVNGSAPTSRYLGMSGTRGTGPHQDEVSGGVDALTPETDYCFRLWVRSVGGTFSSSPTNWACTRTLPSMPLAPPNVRAHRQRTLDSVASPAIVEWSSPDQSAHRRVTRFDVERQSPPGPDRPWVKESSIPGPDGQQTAASARGFRIKSSALPAQGEHIFRVCAVNERGRQCAAPVVATWMDMKQTEIAAQAPRFQPEPQRGMDTMPRVVPRKADAAPPAAADAMSKPRPAVAPAKKNMQAPPSAFGRPQ